MLMPLFGYGMKGCFLSEGVNILRMEKKLPIGMENFEDIRTEGFYYVDKTGFIKELLQNWGKVNLFTRPRRFGKSLNMNMLKYFLSYGCNSRLFEGLEIAGETKLCREYMGKFPVIFVSLKDVAGRDYQTARNMLSMVIGRETMRFAFLLESSKISEREKKSYERLLQIEETGAQEFGMSDEVLAASLQLLCSLLHKHYGKKAVLLMDEYDVPLDKAQQEGYYDEMVALLRNLFSQSLKTNDGLYFAVLTGCLRIAKESIFTGLNNLNVMTITNVRFSRCFGFLDEEVEEMLVYYGLEDKFDLVREWYDGYCFGNSRIYCPWDVINYIYLLRAEPYALPKAFWIHTSGNDMIQKFLEKADQSTRYELERLVNGENIAKRLDQELTYQELYQSIDNLWSVLFTTGYLTQRGTEDGEIYQLAIPNQEIRQIFIRCFFDWFRKETNKDTVSLEAFCGAFVRADAQTIEKQLCSYLKKTISIRDTGAKKGSKENFYHGILLGLLGYRGDWRVISNAEAGLGYSDILIEIEEEQIGIIIEVKYPAGGNLEAGCKKALQQIKEMDYEDRLRQDGMETILKYGIACFKKSCRVILERQ